MKGSFLTIAGTLAQEEAFELRQLFPEECGLAAVVSLPNASRHVFDCLSLQVHRGEDSVGIVSLQDDEFFVRRRVGRVREQFSQVDFQAALPGAIAIGHNRYATQGDVDTQANIQPIFFRHTRYGPFAIAHNGTLFGHQEIRARLSEEGVLFQTSMDSEIFGHLIVRSGCESLEEAVIHATRRIPAAYSLLVLSREQLIACRDPHGVRPLSLGKLDDGYLVCSENYTFEQYPRAEQCGEVEAGELVVFDRGKPGFRRVQYAQPDEHFCIFEGIYFSDPRSRYRGTWHEDFRHALGQKLYAENPHLQGDCIVPVLESGKHAAIGLSDASGIPYKEYFKRQNSSRTKRRSFTSHTDAERIRTAYQKLHLRREQVRGKRVIIVDDSVVRSTTIRLINQRLREAGAASIINCISAPPIVNTCPYGMDFQTTRELIAYNNSIEEIRQRVNADALFFLSLEGLHEVVEKTYRCGTCSGCFGGRYPTRAGCTPERARRWQRSS